MKSKKGKRLLAAAIVVIVAVLALPLSNLAYSPVSSAMARIPADDPVTGAAMKVLAHKCGFCHSTTPSMPLYAKLPGIRSIIEADIAEGTRYIEYSGALAARDGKTVSEVVLAKTEHAIEGGAMPPARFKAMHWTGALTEQEKLAIQTWIFSVRRDSYAGTGAAKPYETEVVQPLPATVEVDVAKANVGNTLFHDKRLSKDDTLSCASCHDLAKGGTDQAQYSTGVGNVLGGINSPTVYNSGFQFMQFWDGRAGTLEQQADGPVNNPMEMACNWPEAFAKLSQDAAFMQEFTAVFPDGLTADNCTSAIAEFERTLVTPNCKLDRYLAGNSTALSEDEKEGYRLFKEMGCAMCHVGKLMGGQSFERLGRKADYFAERGATLTDADQGRYNVTKTESDRHAFKTPTLRNIAKTHPYFHDGMVKDLGEAIQKMAKYQLGIDVSADETAKLVAFMNALTGEYNGQTLQ